MRAWKWLVAPAVVMSTLFIYGVFAVVFGAAEANEITCNSPVLGNEREIMFVARPQGGGENDVTHYWGRFLQEIEPVFPSQPNCLQLGGPIVLMVHGHHAGLVDMDAFLAVQDMEYVHRSPPPGRDLGNIRPLLAGQHMQREILDRRGHFSDVVHEDISVQPNLSIDFIVLEHTGVFAASNERAFYFHAYPRLVTYLKLPRSKAIGFTSSEHGIHGRLNLRIPDAAGFNDCVVGGLDSASSGREGFTNIVDTDTSNKNRGSRYQHHQESPKSHILLSIQVLAGIGLLLAGLYGINHTFARSAFIHPNTGAKFILLCSLVVISGCYLIASAMYS